MSGLHSMQAGVEIPSPKGMAETDWSRLNETDRGQVNCYLSTITDE
jgi:hypothetical protein